MARESESVMANMQIEERTPERASERVATPTTDQPSKGAEAVRGRPSRGCFAPLLSPLSSRPGLGVCRWARWTEEWINKFVDFGQSGKTGEKGDCTREGRKEGRKDGRKEDGEGGDGSAIEVVIIRDTRWIKQCDFRRFSIPRTRSERASRAKKAIRSFRFPTVVTKPFSAATTTTTTNEEDGGRERVSGGRWSGAAESEFDA